jgi:hypothetical protein
MGSKVSLKQKIWTVSIVVLLVISFSLFNVAPALAHIPEGWCPIEECWKYVGGAGPGGGVADISVAATYKAMSMAIDELWDGRPPRRSDIEIISRLPTAGAEHAARCIVGIPEGEVPSEWKSDSPGEFVGAPSEVKDLSLENFEIAIIRKSTGEEYTWKPDADIFPEGYFEYWSKEAGGEELKWWEESRYGDMKSKPVSKLEESIGLVLANELHDNYAHPLDEEIVGKVDSEGTILYLAAALAESGDKGELEILREKVYEASELIDGFHELAHHGLVPLAEEMGKGEHEVSALHDLGHKLMASIYKVGVSLDEIEKTDDINEIKEKAGEMLEEAKRLKEFSSEAHIHSTDPATVFTEQKPLRLKDAGEVIEIEYKELQKHHSELTEGKEKFPIGGAITLSVIIVAGFVTLAVMRRKRVSLKQKIGVVSIVMLLVTISLSLFDVAPALAHIPEGWCPIEECWKYVEGAAPGGAAVADVSVAAIYKAMSVAVDELWGGKPPRRNDIRIISNLPTVGAEHASRCIVGIPEGEVPSEWKSDSPGEFVGTPSEVKDLGLEDFEITIIRESTGEEYTWKPNADIFPKGYFEYWSEEVRGEKLKWWEESRYGDMKGKPVSKLEESIGLILSNELHDNYAHLLDEEIIGKVDSEGTILYLVAALAESGDKGELEILREKVNEASERIDGMHELIHGMLVPLAEEMGKGEHEVNALHDLAHKLMASIYKIGVSLDEIENIDDVDKVKEKASEMLEEARSLKEFSSEAHIHSTDPATVFTEQKPLKLKDAGEVIEIKYKELQKYYSEMVAEKEKGPIGGAIVFGAIVVGLITLGVMRRKRT